MTAPQVVDARTGPVTLRHDAHTTDMARTIKAVLGLPTLGAAFAAGIDALYHTLPDTASTLVDPGDPPAPVRPDVDPGQGEAQPPAPTTARVLVPVEDHFRGRIACTEYLPGPWCETPATWWFRTDGRGGRACCDDHIPDGWVRPHEVIALTDPVVCPTCGERSEHEECS